MNPLENLLIELQQAKSEKDRSWIALQYNIAQHPPFIREMLHAAAIPHRFNSNLLARTSAASFSVEEFELFTSLPYVEIFSEKMWNVHEQTRELLIQHLRDENPLELRRISRQGAAWCRKFFPADFAWRVESVFLSLLAEERSAKENFIDLGWSLVRSFEYGMLESLARNIEELKRLGWKNGSVAAWSSYFEARRHRSFSRPAWTKELALEALETVGSDINLKAHATFILGEANDLLSEMADADKCFNSALTLYRQLGDTTGAANCIRSIASLKYLLCDHQAALKLYRQALKIYQEDGNTNGEANCYHAMADLYATNDDFKMAREFCDAALKIHRRIHDRLGLANCVYTSGTIHQHLGDLLDARSCYQSSLKMYQSRNGRLGEANSLRALGANALYLHDLSEAEEFYARAQLIFSEIGDPLGEANCDYGIGRTLLARGYLSDSEHRVVLAQERYMKHGYMLGLSNCLSERGEIAWLTGRFHESNKLFSDCLQIGGQIKSVACEADTFLAVALRYLFAGFYRESIILFDKSIALSEDIVAYVGRADANFKMGNIIEAEKDLSAATAKNSEFFDLKRVEAEIALWKGDASQAAELLSKGMRITPKNGVMHVCYAVCKALLGEEWRSSFKSGLEHIFFKQDIKNIISVIRSLELKYDGNLLAEISQSLTLAAASHPDIPPCMPSSIDLWDGRSSTK